MFDKSWVLPDIEKVTAKGKGSIMSSAAQPVPVTADNFMRAESDKAFDGIVKQGGFGKFFHARALQSLKRQVVPRINRDTLYSIAILDLEGGPATVTLPDAGERFLSMQVLDEDEYIVKVAYGKGRHTFARHGVDTRYRSWWPCAS